jgi:hypothetical protein
MKQDKPKKQEPKGYRHGNGEVKEIHGSVLNYLLNPRGEVDGLLLEDGTFIKFSPHLGRELTQLARPTDEVTVIGPLEGPKLLKGYVVINPRTKIALREIKPAPPERAALTGPLQPFRVEGKIKYTKRNSHGEIDGAILEDGLTLLFPPHAGYGFPNCLKAMNRCTRWVLVRRINTEQVLPWLCWAHPRNR